MKKALGILILIVTLFTMNAYAQSRYAERSVLASGTWVKIRVAKEGVYQLTKAQLSNMGFKNPDNVRLYGYNRPMLPEACIENIEDDLVEIPLYRKAASGALLFYSKGTVSWTRTGDLGNTFTHRQNPYSTYIYYFLTENSESSPREFATLDKGANSNEDGSTQTATTFYDHALIDYDEFSFLNAGRTFFEAYDFATGNTKRYSVPLPGISNDTVQVTVQFGAAGSSASTLAIKSGDTQIGSLSFYKLAEYQYADVCNETFTMKGVKTDALPVTLQHTRNSGVSGHLDYIKVAYQRNLDVKGEKYLTFTPQYKYVYVNNGKYTTKEKRTITNYQISGADSKTSVWRITDVGSIAEVPATLNGSSLCISLDKSVCGMNEQYVAVNTAESHLTPESVGKIANQNLHELDSIDFVIIVPSSGKLTQQAQRLADAHKEREGMRCAVISADKIYNEFSSGTPDATAYRRFMKMLYDKAQADGDLDNAPKNILLFGAAMWDNRFISTGMKTKKQDDYLLCYESENSWSHTDSYVLEEYFTLLDDGEGVSPLKEKPDAGVGRIPVNTASEAKDVVDKLIRYINNDDAGSWKNTICFMADDGNNNIHMEDARIVSNNTEGIYPDFQYKKIFWDSYPRKQSATGNSYPDAYAAINKQMQDGALIMNYTGHGAAYCLSHEQVLKTADFQNWSSPRLPLWLTAACDVCPFDMNTTNIAVEALLNKNGAAMGCISTARTVYSSPNRSINRYFMSHVLGNGDDQTAYTIGEALALAKCDILDSKMYLSKTDTINKVHFVLMGDPAIRLVTPTYKVKIDMFNGKPADSKTIHSISAGDVIVVEGHIVDEKGKTANDFNGVISPAVLDNLDKIVCMNNDGKSDSLFYYYDRTKQLYIGNDSVRNGKFTFTFPVPVDISYSGKTGIIHLYAVSNDLKTEANGRYQNFMASGTSPELSEDTIGPKIQMYLDTPEFVNGMSVGEEPVLYAKLSDDNGINTTGTGVGHDITAIIDNNEATTYSLNSYFKQNTGDYKEGTLVFSIPKLPAGNHTLTLRAFDTLNNPGSTKIEFVVIEGLEYQTEIFDVSGRKLSDSEKAVLHRGIYIKRITQSSPQGKVTSTSNKFIVTQ